MKTPSIFQKRHLKGLTILTLYSFFESIIDKDINTKYDTTCACFVDFQKAFDSVT